MQIDASVLKKEEKVVFTLRSLYEKYGFNQYKMSKFEEYDLYVKNKDFLVSDNIITFTDTDGKLLALKPDVTLSIIKNTNESKSTVEKVYYNENVYRVSKGTESYKEIMQVGLECIGDIDDFNIYETLMLACESLKSISQDFVLDISHMGIVSEIIESFGVSRSVEKALLKCIGEKNIHGIKEICKNEGIDGTKLEKLVSLYGNPQKVITELKRICQGESLNQLTYIVSELCKNGYQDSVRIDFSVINDMSYYNGFVFKGFINGISAGVLSGGQYDNLMLKMRKKAKAVGFAVYLDMLERLEINDKEYDVDALILYDESTNLSALNDAIKLLAESGKSVAAQKNVPEKLKYRQLLRLKERGVEIIENNA
ncbi:MAG: ATP phosphoribosyltransferase regulatory subunit [Clostridia bacterium]|nr:ATP phosphoribosyltransferase regulatory subunit [Clostridia bacterium]